IDVAGRPADGRGELVAVREADAEPGADPFAVVGRHVLPGDARLVVEALEARPHVAERRDAVEPGRKIGELLLLRLRGRFRLGGVVCDLLLGRVADRLLLLDLLAQLVQLLLRPAELLLEQAEPLLGGGLRTRAPRDRELQDERARNGADRRADPPLLT